MADSSNPTSRLLATFSLNSAKLVDADIPNQGQSGFSTCAKNRRRSISAAWWKIITDSVAM